MSEAKPFGISKWEVWEAYKRVKANQGAAGVDEQSIADFEKRLQDNLYKIWNRMSSGSYFPPPVRTVKIPKANGGERKLGIPTVRANCTCAPYAFGVGGNLSSFPPAAWSAL
jgi:RNA-directed DNA polymerase